MTRDELSKCLLSLGVFPDLTNNLELKRILESIEGAETCISPRDDSAVEKAIVYEAFEQVLLQIAFKAFQAEEQGTEHAISQLVFHIKEPAKNVYFVRLMTGKHRIDLCRLQALLQKHNGGVQVPAGLGQVADVDAERQSL